MQEYIKNSSDTNTILSMYKQNLLDDQLKEEIDGLSVEQFLEYWKENLVTFINGKDYTSSDDTFITDSVGNKYDIKHYKHSFSVNSRTGAVSVPKPDTLSYKVSDLIENNYFNFTPPSPSKLTFNGKNFFNGIYLELNSEKILNRNYTQFFKIKLVKNVNSKNKTLFNINGNKYLSRITKEDNIGNDDKMDKAFFKYKYTNRSVNKEIDWETYFKNRNNKWNSYIITNEKHNAYKNKINIYFNGVNISSDILFRFLGNDVDKFKNFGLQEEYPEKVQYAGIINERLSDTAIKILHEKMSQ